MCDSLEQLQKAMTQRPATACTPSSRSHATPSPPIRRRLLPAMLCACLLPTLISPVSAHSANRKYIIDTHPSFEDTEGCHTVIGCLPLVSEEEFADSLRKGFALSDGANDRTRYELYKRLSPIVNYVAHYPDANASTLLYVSNANYQPVKDLDIKAESFTPPADNRWVGNTYEKVVGSITKDGQTTEVIQSFKRNVLIYVGQKVIEQAIDSAKADYQSFYAQPSAQLQRYDEVLKAKAGASQTFSQLFALVLKDPEAKKASDVILQQYGLSTDMSAEQLANALGTKAISRDEILQLLKANKEDLGKRLTAKFADAAQANQKLLKTAVAAALAKSDAERRAAELDRQQADYEAKVKNDALVGTGNLIGALWTLHDPEEGKKVQILIEDGLKLQKTIELYRPALDAGGQLGALGTMATLTNAATISMSILTTVASLGHRSDSDVLFEFLQQLQQEVEDLTKITERDFSRVNVQLASLTELTRRNFASVENILARQEATQELLLEQMEDVQDLIVRFESEARTYAIETIQMLKTNPVLCETIANEGDSSLDQLQREYDRCGSDLVDLATRGAKTEAIAGDPVVLANDHDLETEVDRLYAQNVFGRYPAAVPSLGEVPRHINALNSIVAFITGLPAPARLANPLFWQQNARDLLQMSSLYISHDPAIRKTAADYLERVREPGTELAAFITQVSPNGRPSVIYDRLAERIGQTGANWSSAERQLRAAYSDAFLNKWPLRQLAELRTLEHPEDLTPDLLKEGYRDVRDLKPRGELQAENLVRPCEGTPQEYGSYVVPGDALPVLNGLSLALEDLLTADRQESALFTFCYRVEFLGDIYTASIDGNGITSAVILTLETRRPVRITLVAQDGNSDIAVRRWISKEAPVIREHAFRMKQDYLDRAGDAANYWRSHGTMPPGLLHDADDWGQKSDLFKLSSMGEHLNSAGALAAQFEDKGQTDSQEEIESSRTALEQYVQRAVLEYRDLVVGILSGDVSRSRPDVLSRLAAPIAVVQQRSAQLYEWKSLVSALLDLTSPYLVDQDDELTSLLYGDETVRVIDPWAIARLASKASGVGTLDLFDTKIPALSTQRLSQLTAQLGSIDPSNVPDHPLTFLMRELDAQGDIDAIDESLSSKMP